MAHSQALLACFPPSLHPHLAGFKEKPRSGTVYNRSEIVECGKGEVSFWNGSALRTPTNAEECQGCTGGNKYAPRTGAAGRSLVERQRVTVCIGFGGLHPAVSLPLPMPCVATARPPPFNILTLPHIFLQE